LAPQIKGKSLFLEKRKGKFLKGPPFFFPKGKKLERKEIWGGKIFWKKGNLGKGKTQIKFSLKKGAFKE